MLSAISGFCAIPANLFGGRLADRIPAFAVLFVFDGLIHGGLFPSIDAMSADLCPSRHRGTFSGVMRLLGMILAVPAPLAGAWLWAHLGPAAPMRLASAIALLTGILLFKYAPAPGRTTTPAAPKAASST